jgi:hypothetical protein
MSGTIHQHEELRAGMLDAAKTPCSVCNVACWGECSNCFAPMCTECAVKCVGCKSDNEYCLACAVRCGYAEIMGKHWCENCAPWEEA